MKIQLTVFDNGYKKNSKSLGERLEFTGVWALEDMIKKLITRYYSDIIASKVMDLLRDRRTGE